MSQVHHDFLSLKDVVHLSNHVLLVRPDHALRQAHDVTVFIVSVAQAVVFG